MSKAWPLVSLGELLRLERRPVKVVPEGQYAEIGIYCFGRGIFHKSPRSGFEVGNKGLFLIKDGDFILQVTFAWEGAVALASTTEDGMFGSTRFPTFRVDESRCHPLYLLNYFKTKEGREQLIKISPGSAGRNRVLSMKRIPEVLVLLPPLSEQQQIVVKIEELSAKIEEAKGLTWKAIVETKLVLDASIKNLFSKITSRSKIKTIVDINYGEGLRKQERIETGIYDVYGSGGLIGKHDKCITTAPFVIIGRKGSAGEITYSPNGGWVIDTAYYAIPKNNNMLLTKFFFYSLKAIDIKSGTIVTAIPGINRDSIYEKEIAFPSIDKQQRIIKYLDNLQSKIYDLRRIQSETQKELVALLPSILDKAFKGEL